MRITGALGLVVAAGLFTAPMAASAPGCAALGGAVADGACRVSEATPGYTLDITFPLGYPDEQSVIDYLNPTKAGFVMVAETPEERSRPYEMDVTADSFRSAQTRSLVLTLFQDTGTAHPTTWYRSFTYDVTRNRPVDFDNLFAPDSEPLQAIFPIVQRELESRTGLVGAVNRADGLDPSHYQNFAITDDAVIFFFARAELLPSYAGATSVSVPRAELPPLAL